MRLGNERMRLTACPAMALVLMRASRVLAGSLLVQGCAFIQNQDAIDARLALIGRTRPEIMACAGIPNEDTKAGTKEIATYSVAARYLTGGAILGLKNCTVSIVFEQGRVFSVDYIVDDPGPLAPLESCAEIVSVCLRQ